MWPHPSSAKANSERGSSRAKSRQKPDVNVDDVEYDYEIEDSKVDIHQSQKGAMTIQASSMETFVRDKNETVQTARHNNSIFSTADSK